MKVLYSYYYHCFGHTKANAEEVGQERERDVEELPIGREDSSDFRHKEGERVRP